MKFTRRSSIAVVLGGVLVASLVPIGYAIAAPTIQFWSPSGYTTNLTISNKEDTDTTVHLVATVGEVPANPLVEFEISSATNPGITLDASMITTDTWDADMQISSLTEGTYTLTANLFSNLQQVAQDTTQVTVSKDDELPPPAPNTVEMTYPVNGGNFGLNAPKGDKPINGLVDVTASEGTQQVRALYTTSAPGTEPAWVACGFAEVGEDRTARIRCSLATDATLGSVKGIAVVANDTPAPADPSVVGDASGEAHRVTAYEQVARNVDVSPELVSNAVVDECQKFTATVTDQNNRAMAASNVDVDAVGPDDQIRFGVITGETSAFQAPDKAHVANPRASINCANAQNSGQQGDHNIPGEDDPQHIESTSGTSNFGQFTFALLSSTTGGTIISVWADENDDDVQQAAETSNGSRLGWGVPPPDATRDLFLDPSSSSAESGSCQRVELLGKLSGSPDSGQGVDIHITGPDETVNFCLPADASTGSAPNAGVHTGNADDATTRHLEGQLDSNGKFVFGVTSAGEGTTTIVAWADTLEDDIQGTDEASETGSIGWAVTGERTISIRSSKSKVATGRIVRISGRIDGAAACEMSQAVKLKSKRLNGGRFRLISSKTADAEGDYLFRVRVKRSRKYKTTAPTSGACETATSRVITVRAI